jgi:NAD(P)H-quinone oxidoreductase subunit 4
MLSILLLLPLVGAILISLLPNSPPNSPGNLLARRVTIAISLILTGLSTYLLTQLNLGVQGFQLQESLDWLPQLGLSYSLGVDGLSLPLIILNGFLTWIAVLTTSKTVDRPKLYYAMILLVNAGVTGAFAAQNLMLFFLFYELELIPFYLLLAIWGGERRQYAAVKFLLYTAVSGILILAAFFGMAWLGGGNSFDYDKIDMASISATSQLIILTLLIIGFGIKVPLVPVHTWQPDAYVEASPAVAMLLGGVLAKLGTYGLIRFGLQCFPEAWPQVAPILAILGSISVIYGALSAIAQHDIKRMVAYSSIGHMGYIIVAIAAASPLSLLGAVAQMIGHGLILAMLFQVVGTIETKTGTRDLDQLNGLLNPVRGLPATSALLIVAGMASAGIPGMVGFIAEFMVFQGSFSAYPIPTLLCILSSGLTAVYFVILINRTCFGKLDNDLAYYPTVTLGDQAPALILAVLIFVLGIQPNWLIQWTEPTTNAMVSLLNLSSQIAMH